MGSLGLCMWPLGRISKSGRILNDGLLHLGLNDDGLVLLAQL